jgi:hypothetical protein
MPTPAADPAQLFISYRRDDSAGYARALHEALAQAYGHERVFIDVDDIAAGQRFADVIASALDSSAVLLVLIGPRWVGPSDSAPARIHNPQDFVRREVETGLAQGLHLVPVLLDGTPLPGPTELPASLHALLERNAMALGSQGFQAGLAQLMTALQPHLGPARAAPGAPTPAPLAGRPPSALARMRPLLLGAAALGLSTAGTVAWWWYSRGPRAADFVGDWTAEVTYPWPNAVYTERLQLRLEGDTWAGSASFLRVPRVVSQVQLDAQGLRFSTRSTSTDGQRQWEEQHHYRLQRRPDGGLLGEMRTDSDGAVRYTLSFTARPSGPSD